MNTIQLSRPITAHGEETSELNFREPTVKDIRQIGLPQRLVPSTDGESVSVEVRADIVGQYIARLAAIPLSSVDQLAIRDFNACMGVVMGFFNGGAE